MTQETKNNIGKCDGSMKIYLLHTVPGSIVVYVMNIGQDRADCLYMDTLHGNHTTTSLLFSLSKNKNITKTQV